MPVLIYIPINRAQVFCFLHILSYTLLLFLLLLVTLRYVRLYVMILISLLMRFRFRELNSLKKFTFLVGDRTRISSSIGYKQSVSVFAINKTKQKSKNKNKQKQNTQNKTK